MRKDIQALRAIAVVVVLLYHFWPNRLSGGYVGVDVFFVISGFLITLHLIKRPPTTWKSLVDFWSRRVKRLIPAATVVLLATIVASLIWLPETMIQTVLKEAAVAAIYGENWMLAATATDYLASTDAPSPIQHYWSLSVEEQFYIVWPVIIGSIFLLGRRFLTANKLLATSMVAIFVASLVYSIYLTSADPAAAYFITPTRVWELALGGGVALLATRFVVPARLAVPMVWIGLAMIGAAVMLFTADTPFPGYTALLPTVGAALVIFAATDNMRWSPRRLLGLKPVQFIGDISYSIYLWHWPVLIIAPFAFGVSKLSLVYSISLIVNIVVLAYLTKVYIEDPVRQSKRLVGTNFRTYAYGLASIVIVIGATFAVTGHPKVQAAQNIEKLKVALETDPCVGAGVLREEKCRSRYEGQVLASPAWFRSDRALLYKDKCSSARPVFPKNNICEYGNRDSETRVALLGNSHAAMWYAAIDSASVNNNWSLDTYISSSCYTIDRLIIQTGQNASENCRDWNNWAVGRIAKEGYDVVVFSNRSSQRLVGVEKGQEMYDEQVLGYVEVMDKLLDSGVKVFVLRDTPVSKNNKSAPDCLAINKTSSSSCNGERSKVLVDDPLYEAASRYNNQNIQALDLTDRFCDDTVCYAVIGGVVIYYDHNHLTNSYVKTLTPDIEKPLVDFVNKKSQTSV